MSLIRTEDNTLIHLTSKEDEDRAKECLERHRLVLKMNIIPCTEFLELLIRCGILSRGTVDSITKLSNREEMNERIIDLVSLYGAATIFKFGDALHLSGHIYLSDLLHSALNGIVSSQQSLVHLPKFNSKTLCSEDIALLSTFIQQAITEGVLREMWESGSSAKEQAIKRRQRHLQDGWKLLDQLKDKDRNAELAKSQLQSAENEILSLKRDIERLSHQLEQEKTKNKEELMNQINCNQAHERSLQRLTSRLQETDRAIENMFLSVIGFVEREDMKVGDARMPKEKLYRDTSLTFLDKLRDVLQHMMAKYEEMVRQRLTLERLQTERDFVLRFIDGNCAEDNFKEVFGSYVNKNEDTINRLKEKTKKRKTKLDKAREDIEIMENRLSTTRQEMESLRVTLKFKEAHIRKLMQDRSQLKEELTTTTTKKPSLANLVAKLVKTSTASGTTTSDKEATSRKPPLQPSSGEEVEKPGFSKSIPKASGGLLTEESSEDFKRMLGDYFTPNRTENSVQQTDAISSQRRRLHIVLPQTNNYIEEHPTTLNEETSLNKDAGLFDDTTEKAEQIREEDISISTLKRLRTLDTRAEEPRVDPELVGLGETAVSNGSSRKESSAQRNHQRFTTDSLNPEILASKHAAGKSKLLNVAERNVKPQKKQHEVGDGHNAKKDIEDPDGKIATEPNAEISGRSAGLGGCVRGHSSSVIHDLNTSVILPNLEHTFETPYCGVKHSNDGVISASHDRVTGNRTAADASHRSAYSIDIGRVTAKTSRQAGKRLDGIRKSGTGLRMAEAISHFDHHHHLQQQQQQQLQRPWRPRRKDVTEDAPSHTETKNLLQIIPLQRKR